MFGKSINGNTIPLINPYWDKASLQLRPDFSNLRGINNCLIVERPERIYEVIATGILILNIFFEKLYFEILLVCSSFLWLYLYKK